MIIRDIVSDILLGLAVLIVLGASVGVIVMRDACQAVTASVPGTLDNVTASVQRTLGNWFQARGG